MSTNEYGMSANEYGMSANERAMRVCLREPWNPRPFFIDGQLTGSPTGGSRSLNGPCFQGCTTNFFIDG